MTDPGLPLRLRERAEHLQTLAARVRAEALGCPWRSTAAAAMRGRADEAAADVEGLAQRVHDVADGLARSHHLAVVRATALVEAAVLAAARAEVVLQRLAGETHHFGHEGEAAEGARAVAAELAHRAEPARAVLRDLAG